MDLIAGAFSFILSVGAIAGGQNVYGAEIIGRLPQLMSNTSSFDYSKFDINEKEQEIIELVADGLSNKEIASKLYLSEGTVKLNTRIGE